MGNYPVVYIFCCKIMENRGLAYVVLLVEENTNNGVVIFGNACKGGKNRYFIEKYYEFYI